MTPKISVVIPTLNAGSVLNECLGAISKQNYPKELVEIIISDGGSKDNTLELARQYGAKIVENRLMTGEAGKAAGVKVTTGDYIALIDSDNYLPDANWFNQMILPLEEHSEAVGSEPWEFTYRKEDGFIDRYCAMLGMNDPLCHFIGNYDRKNLLTGKWTGLNCKQKDNGDYIIAELSSGNIPTIGANGTVFRAEFLKKRLSGDYLFDIDILASEVEKTKVLKFIKVKNGIIHQFCGSDINKFIRKQKRRIKDYLYYSHLGVRSYKWGLNRSGIIKFVMATVFVFPVVWQSLRGYFRSKDPAWFFHPLACWITLSVNVFGMLSARFNRSTESRASWRQ